MKDSFRQLTLTPSSERKAFEPPSVRELVPKAAEGVSSLRDEQIFVFLHYTVLMQKNQ